VNKTVGIAVLVVAAMVGLAGGWYFAMHQGPSSAQADTRATLLYGQSLPDSGGQVHPLASLKGKIVVVNFWATWCEPCVREIPEMSRVQSEFSNKNVQFVGIGIDNAANILEFQKRVAPTYPLLVAGAGGSDLVRDMGDAPGALPYTLVLDTSGKVLESKLGAVSEDELRAWLAKATGA
jgi:thiol-disulfide isomerase/thioredoxin